LDENASDFEHWVSDAIVQLLRLQGIEDTPVFKRQRISNQREQVEILVQEAAWLDEATILRKLPNLTPDEVSAAIAAKDGEDMARMGIAQGLIDEG
jgi:prophage antirepressor-like protein